MPDEIPSAAHSAAMLVNLQHHIADEHKQLTPTVGKVLTPPPDLSVEWNNIVITREQIYLNEYWLPGHTRHIVGETDFRGGGSGYPAYESHNHPINNDETWTDTLKPGDFVSVYPQEGGQLFIIENKLVKL